MPWQVFKKGNKWCVYKHDADGKPVGSSLGCHPSESEAREQQKALYANEKKAMEELLVETAKAESEDKDSALAETMQKSVDLETIKSISDDRVGAYAVLWGDEERKDLDGDFFTPETEELTVIFDTVGGLPYLYHHSLDKTIKTGVLGVVDTLKADHVGLWYEAQLKLSDDYGRVIKKLIDQGKLKTSTQTFPVAIRKSADGKILRWPIVEITATPTPAEYRMQPIATLKGAYQSIGCTDFDCMLKNKLGIETDEGERQGSEKERLWLELEQSRLALAEI